MLCRKISILILFSGSNLINTGPQNIIRKCLGLKLNIIEGQGLVYHPSYMFGSFLSSYYMLSDLGLVTLNIQYINYLAIFDGFNLVLSMFFSSKVDVERDNNYTLIFINLLVKIDAVIALSYFFFNSLVLCYFLSLFLVIAFFSIFIDNPYTILNDFLLFIFIYLMYSYQIHLKFIPSFVLNLPANSFYSIPLLELSKIFIPIIIMLIDLFLLEDAKYNWDNYYILIRFCIVCASLFVPDLALVTFIATSLIIGR